MGQVSVVHESQFDWYDIPDTWPGKAKPGEPQTFAKRLMAKADGHPGFQLVNYEPNHFEPPHEHDEDEAFFLISGSLLFGAETLTQGALIHVPRNTRYSLKATGEGAYFMRIAW